MTQYKWKYVSSKYFTEPLFDSTKGLVDWNYSQRALEHLRQNVLLENWGYKARMLKKYLSFTFESLNQKGMIRGLFEKGKTHPLVLCWDTGLLHRRSHVHPAYCLMTPFKRPLEDKVEKETDSVATGGKTGLRVLTKKNVCAKWCIRAFYNQSKIHDRDSFDRLLGKDYLKELGIVPLLTKDQLPNFPVYFKPDESLLFHSEYDLLLPKVLPEFPEEELEIDEVSIQQAYKDVQLRAQRNPFVAIPILVGGKVKLLIPFSLKSKAIITIVLERKDSKYVLVNFLSAEDAYIAARCTGVVQAQWLLNEWDKQCDLDRKQHKSQLSPQSINPLTNNTASFHPYAPPNYPVVYMHSPMSPTTTQPPILQKPLPQNYKTTLCRSYRAGHCKYGDQCHFAHGQSELRTIGQTNQQQPRSSQTSNSQSAPSTPTKAFSQPIHIHSQQMYQAQFDQMYSPQSPHEFFAPSLNMEQSSSPLNPMYFYPGPFQQHVFYPPGPVPPMSNIPEEEEDGE